MFFVFWNKKDKNAATLKIEPLNEIVDGEYEAILGPNNNLNQEEEMIVDDMDVIDLDKEHEEGKAGLGDAYKMLGLEHLPVTEAVVKQAYYERRQEIRQYHFSGENRMLVELKKAYELVLTYPEDLIQNNEISKSEEPIYSDVVVDDTKESPEELIEELILWDDMMDEIDGMRKKNRMRRKIRSIVLLSVLFTVMLTCICALKELGMISAISGKVSRDTISLYLENYQLDLEHGQELMISELDLDQMEVLHSFHVPLLRFYMQDINCSFTTGDVMTSSRGFLFYRYELDKGERIEYYPLRFVPINTQTIIDFTGTWKGSFKASRENTSISTVTIKIQEEETGTLTGICEIEADNGKKGSYYIEVLPRKGTTEVTISGKEWINKPTFFIMSDFEAYYDIQKKTLLPVKDTGPVFEITKEQE